MSVQSVVDFQAEVGRGAAEVNRVVGALFGGICVIVGVVLIGNGLAHIKDHKSESNPDPDPTNPNAANDAFTPKQHVYLGLGLVAFGAVVAILTWSLSKAVRHGNKGFAAVVGTVAEVDFLRAVL